MKRAIGRCNSFDRGDAFAGNGSNRNAAGAGDLAIEVHAARATGTNATAKLGAGQSKLLADDPEEWRIRIRLNREGLAVDLKLDGHPCSPAVFDTFPSL